MRIFILFLIIAIHTFTMAQNNDFKKQFVEIEKMEADGKLKSALPKVEAIYKKSKNKVKWQSFFIKSLLYKSKIALITKDDVDDKLLIVNDFKKEIQSNRNAESGAVLQSMLAEVLWDYYQRNSYKINNRTETQEVVSNDFRTWSSQIFLAEIAKHYSNSIKNLEQYSSTPIADWNYILVPQEKSMQKYQELRPTLMDLLANRAIDFYQNSISRLYYFKQDSRNLVEESHQEKAKEIQQLLVDFHTKNNNPVALLAIKTKIAKQKKADLAMVQLKQLSQEFKTNWNNGFTLYSLAKVYEEKALQAEDNQDKELWLNKLLAACQKAIKSYPNTIGAENAKGLSEHILQPNVDLQVEEYLPNNQTNPIKINHQNTNQLYVKILKTNRSLKAKSGFKVVENSSQEEIQNLLKRYPLVKEYAIQLKEFSDYQNHSTLAKLPALPTGEYLVLVSNHADFKLDNKTVIKYEFINVSAYAISSRQVKNKMQLYVTNRTTGMPAANQTIEVTQVYRQQYNQEGSFTTDQSGFVEFPMLYSYTNYFFNIKNEPVYSSQYASRYRENRKEKNRIVSKIFTDRSIYRPGQVVYFKLITYEHNPNTNEYKVLPKEEEYLLLENPNGEEVSEIDLITNEFGSANGQFVLPSGGITGQFHLESDFGDAYIQVEEYKRPKFEVKFDSIKDTFKLNQEIKVSGFAKAFSGANISEGKVVYRVYRQAIYPFFYWWQGQRPQSEPQEEIAQGETTTNAKGEFVIPFTAKPARTKKNTEDIRTYSYQIAVDVIDLNGETRSGSQVVKVGDRSMILDLELPSKIGKEDFTEFGIKTKNLNGQFVPKKGSYKLSKLQAPNRVLRANNFDEIDYQLYPEKEFINYFPNEDYSNQNQIHKRKKGKVFANGSFNTQESKEVPINAKELPLGYYLLEAEIVANQDTIKTAKTVFVYNPNKTQAIDNELFTVSNPKKTYKPGDVATIYFASSAKKANVWVEVASKGEIIQKKQIPLNANSKAIKIPITEQMRGGLQLSYYFVKYNQAQARTMKLNVPYKSKDLQILVGTTRDKLQPGSQETWNLTIKGPKKEKVAAEMLATMYDASLDQFKPHNINFALNHNKRYFTKLGNWNIRNAFGTNYFNYLPYHSRIYRYYEKSPDFVELNWFGFNINNATGNQRNYVRRLKKSKSEVPPPPSDLVAEMDEAAYVEQPNAGLNMVLSGYGVPGAAKQITLRGISSDFGGKNPLYVVDGEIISEEDFKKINPKDVVDVKVLKNEQATQLYGQKGENGVIIITTKQGQNNPLTQLQARKNLKETAFFFPQLRTDQDGNITFSFTMPESLTQWKFMALAHNKELQTANYEQLVRTQKELMVVPNAPRFLREGDEILFQSKVVNLSQKTLNGKAQLLLFDAFSMQPIDADFANAASKQSFAVGTGESTIVAWNLRIPSTHQAVVYRIVASAGNFSDGEESALPILSNRMLVTETLPLHIREGQKKTFTLDKLLNQKSKSLQNQGLTLELTANPIWYAIMSLPYLREYPYECSEQVFARFYGNIISQHLINSNPKIKAVFDDWNQKGQLVSPLERNEELKNLLLEETPWIRQAQTEAEQQKRLAVLFDLNNMRQELTNTYTKLKAKQYASGGFPWFDGGNENLQITMHILAGLGHLNQMKIDYAKYANGSKTLEKNAIRFVDEQMHKRFVEDQKKNGKKLSKASMIYYLYARSFFTQSHKLPKQYQGMMDDFLQRIKKNPNDHSLQLQAMLAMVLHRNGNSKLAKNILTSVKEYAVESEEFGMYWKTNVAGWFWHNAPVETQAMLIEAFDEVLADEKSVEEMKVWLLKNKQTNQWRTTKATTEAVYALMSTGKDWVNTEDGIELKIGEKTMDLSKMEMQKGSGYVKKQWKAKEIKAKMGKVEIKKSTPGVSWGGLYWQYFEDLDKITTANTQVSMKKELFIQKNTNNGPVLSKITPHTPIAIGDLISVRLELKSDRAMEFVHIKDMRASGFEPVNVISQYKYQEGLGYYESTRDAATNFFVDYMPKGVYVFEYQLRANNAGNFSNGITSLQNMYAPEFSAHSAGIRVSIKE